jgi:hypothetical protein
LILQRRKPEVLRFPKPLVSGQSAAVGPFVTQCQKPKQGAVISVSVRWLK